MKWLLFAIVLFSIAVGAILIGLADIGAGDPVRGWATCGGAWLLIGIASLCLGKRRSTNA